jgi:hypothetical protein
MVAASNVAGLLVRIGVNRFGERCSNAKARLRFRFAVRSPFRSSPLAHLFKRTCKANRPDQSYRTGGALYSHAAFIDDR